MGLSIYLWKQKNHIVLTCSLKLYGKTLFLHLDWLHLKRKHCGVQSVVAARRLLENVKDLQVLCYIQFGEINYDRSCKSKQSWRKKHTRPIFTAHDILNSFFNIHYFQYQYNLATSADFNPSFFTHYFI